MIDKYITPKDIIETGIGSIGKIKIIKALAEEDRMVTVYMLHKKTHLKREDIKRNLEDLVRLGWVREVRLGNTMYSVNKDNHYLNNLLIFFSSVGYTNSQ